MSSKDKKRQTTSNEVVASVDVAGLLDEIGTSMSDTTELLRDFFNQFPGLKEDTFAKIIAMMTCSHLSKNDSNTGLHKFPGEEDKNESNSSAKGWNVVNFVDVVKQLFPELNWPEIIRNLDFSGFQIPDAKGFALLMAIYKRGSKEPFPLEHLFSEWKNTSGQLSIIKSAVAAPPDVFNFSQSPKKVETEGIVASKSSSTNQAWTSLSLIETLLRLSVTENYSVIRSLFNYPIKHCPEILIMGIAQSKVPWNNLANELTLLLLPSMLISNQHSNLIIRNLWANNVSQLFHGMVELYNKDQGNLPRILEIASQDLPAILEYKPFSFAIDLASLASRREFLDFPKWLQDKLKEFGNQFAQACIKHIKEKCQQLINSAKNESNQKLLESIAIIFTTLQNNQSALAPELLGELKQIGLRLQQFTDSSFQKMVDDLSQNLTATSLGNQPKGPRGQMPEARQFAPEVDKAANDLFSRLYDSAFSVEDLINLLKRFKNGSDPREHDIFECMIHNLLDEHQFWPRYPENVLQITAKLFGQLIQHQLVSYWPLGMGLKYILEALKETPPSILFNFGVTAFEQFKSRMHEWPQFATHLLGIPHLRQAHPEMYEFIAKTVEGSNVEQRVPNNPPSQTLASNENAPLPRLPPTSGVNQRVTEAIPPSSAPVKKETSMNDHPSAILLTGLDDAPVVAEAISDKIHFIFNNVSVSNMDQKANEMRELVKTDETVQYLAYYLVVKRVCLEHNFHTLYISFLDKLKIPTLGKYLQAYTLLSIRLLLKSEKVCNSIAERSLLKNLGTWIGLMTLAKNKPLLQKELGLKELLYDAYENGFFVAVIPFVCKIIETCSLSKVFKPPNPWVMAIMRLLSEIYRLPNLKLNLKFEVVVLSKALGLDIEEVPPSDQMKDKRQFTGSPNYDFSPAPQPPTQANSMALPNLNGPNQALNLPPITSVPPSISNAALVLYAMFQPDEAPSTAWIIQLSSFLFVSPAIGLFNQQPQLKNIIPVAIDRAIREIISPVVERSVTIACITTRELVNKDFATEPDDQKLRKSTHMMVQNLAGSLALVTCKEPLRISMSNHLRSLLQTSTPETYHQMIESAVQLLANDNLDLACALIEKAATEKAIRDTEEFLSAASQLRKKQPPRMNAPFVDPSYFAGRFPNALPEMLKPKMGGLAPHQLHVYDDFARALPVSFGDKESEGKRDLNQSGQELSISQAVEKFNSIISEIDSIASRNTHSTLSALSEEQELSVLKHVPFLINQSASKAEVAMSFAQKIFTKMFEPELPSLNLEIYSSILESISGVFSKLPNTISSLIMHSDEERKFNRKVVPFLIHQQLVSMPEIDAHLSKLIETHRNKNAFDFSLFLIRKCIIQGRFLHAQSIRETMDTIVRFVKAHSGKGQEEILKMIEEARNINITARLDSKNIPVSVGPIALRADFTDSGNREIKEQIVRIFEEWVAFYLQPTHNDKALLSLLSQPQFQGYLKDEDGHQKFFKVCIESAIDSAVPMDSSEKPILAFGAIDALTKLVVLLLKYTENNNVKVGTLSRFLSIVVRTLQLDHEAKGAQFNSRPYFRLFFNLLSDLSAHDPTLNENVNLNFLTFFSQAFIAISPLKVPGFSFAWLELVSHRTFMPKLLLFKMQKGWNLLQRLIVDLLRFLEPFLKNAEMTESIRLLYKGTLRVLLVLLHDFPEFLCNYHFSFCDVIPPTCIQMRNLILSAFPRNMRLPDPFTPNLKVDLLPEINQPPRIMSNVMAALNQAGSLKADLDNYLRVRHPQTFLLDLRSKLLLPNDQVSGGTRYNVPLINSLVLYLGAFGVQQNAQNLRGMPSNSPMGIFQHIATDLDSEGRYLFLNAIANQLRYPNSDTHYFSCILLFLFSEAREEVVQEQITRVLLERIIVNRPHPWGLLITFIELIKNPRYSFWSHGFTHCAPEIERLFDSVARSCINTTTPRQTDELGINPQI
eukprot:TRINITY_DN1770_c0_g1_i1.p1 TRINITY_DN1770_c0_g1~~TRINITY_DN1770_c0_g1_i1.p1  ORF type:complete len:1948 (-),score=339.96 TRINITY_DN1770_c0_g1_i1:159-6002(-)